MEERHYQIVDLPGFIIAGLVFIAAGLNVGDTLTIVHSVIWVISCMIWMIPFAKSKQQ